MARYVAINVFVVLSTCLKVLTSSGVHVFCFVSFGIADYVVSPRHPTDLHKLKSFLSQAITQVQSVCANFFVSPPRLAPALTGLFRLRRLASSHLESLQLLYNPYKCVRRHFSFIHINHGTTLRIANSIPNMNVLKTHIPTYLTACALS